MDTYPFPPEYNYPYTVTGQASNAALVFKAENGVEQRRWRNPSKKILRDITITYSALSEGDIDILWDFYLEHGMVEKFYFQDYRTQELIQVCFKEDMTKEEFTYRLFNTGVSFYEVLL